MTHSASSNVATQTLVGILKIVGAEGLVNLLGLQDPNKEVMKEIASEGQTGVFMSGDGTQTPMRFGGRSKED